MNLTYLRLWKHSYTVGRLLLRMNHQVVTCLSALLICHTVEGDTPPAQTLELSANVKHCTVLSTNNILS